MKVLIALMLCGLALVSAQGCAGDMPYKCAVAGGQCGTINGSYYSCPDTQFCNDNNVCTDWLKAGASCAGDLQDDCGDGLDCNSDSVCQAYTFTRTVGQTCDNFNDCVVTATCQQGTCLQIPSTGQNCSVVNQCGDASFCSGFTQTCVTDYSIPQGGNCSDTSDCQPGLFCYYFNSTCQKPGTSSGISCDPSNYTACDGFEACACGANATHTTCQAPFTYSQQQADTENAFYNCLWANPNCITDDICSTCKGKLCDYFDAWYASSYDTTATCNNNPELNSAYAVCHGSSSSASTLAPLLFLLGVASYLVM